MIAALSALCRDHVIEEKILVAPSLAVGHQLGDRIAQGGTPWINLRVETIRTLADAVAGFAIAKDGTRVLSRAQALGLVEQCCDRAFRNDSYFAVIANRPGLHRAMQRSLDDLRNAGITASGMPAKSFESSKKAADLRAVLDEYESALRELRLDDRSGVLSTAIRMLESGATHPYPPGSVWIIAAGSQLSANEERFLELVAGPGPIRLVDDEEAWRDSNATIEIVRGVGEENEIRGVIRSVLARAAEFDQCEIVYTERKTYLPLVYELASEHSISATFAEGVSASFTRPGAAALGFLDWIGRGYEAASIETLLRTGAVVPSRGEVSSVSPLTMARVLRSARIGWGRERHVSRIEAWSAARSRELDDIELSEARRAVIERDVESAAAAVAFLRTLLTITDPLGDNPMLNVGDLARVTTSFVADSAAIRNEIDAMAARAVERLLTELASLQMAEVHRSEAASRLTDAIVELAVAASNPRPGHLHVAPVRLGGWSGRPLVFAVGLDDSRHPGGSSQDPVLLDSEREAINDAGPGGKLPMMSDRPGRNAAELFRFLSRACESAGESGLVTLSYSSLNIQEERERFPSSTLLEVARKVHGHEVRHDELLRRVAATRWSFVPEGAAFLSGTEWWLARIFETPHRQDIAGAIEASYPWLAEGARAEAARASSELTGWDGVIRPSEDLDPRVSRVVVSASRLEKLAGCPYRYFLENVLRVRPVEELDRDPERWLSPAEFGSLLHEILEIFMKETCGRGEKPSPERHTARIHEIADEAIERWKANTPPPNVPSVERQRQDLHEACEIFLRTEARDCSSITARYFEVGFGRETDLLPSFAIDLGGGKSLQLRGRIDRVDSDDNEAAWDVWDYKSGGKYKFTGGGRLRRGTRMQHAIYASVVEALLSAEALSGHVRRSGYYFTSRKGAGERLDIGSDPEELKKTLNLLCDVVAAGLFIHGAEDECKFCDYRAICGDVKQTAMRATRKIHAQSDLAGVQAWLDLQDVP